MLHIIAIEAPSFFKPVHIISACAVKHDQAYIYNAYQEMIPAGKPGDFFDTVKNTVKEYKYEWCDLLIEEGDILKRIFPDIIMLDDNIMTLFTPLPGDKGGRITSKPLRAFNEFLQKVNKDKQEMVKSLQISLEDGFFRQEVEEIIKNDTVDYLKDIDKEIIIGCKLEGITYVNKNINSLLNTKRPDRFVDINYFFRRVFLLEKNNYISFSDQGWRI